MSLHPQALLGTFTVCIFRKPTETLLSTRLVPKRADRQTDGDLPCNRLARARQYDVRECRRSTRRGRPEVV